jgi:fibro-slime domain-containing protein
MRIEFCLGAICLTLLACGSSSPNSAGEGSAWGTGGSVPGTTTPPHGGGSGFVAFTGSDAGVVPGGDASAGVPSMLTVTIRDFKFWNMADATTNPDFQNAIGAEKGIVAAALGADHKPVYAANAATSLTTHGQMYFDQWYHDAPGTNITVSNYPLPLSAGAGGTYGYDSRVSGVALNAMNMTKEWFPIDDGTPYATAFGNQTEPHNYSFTTELHTVFTYQGGETFSFSGDDDCFVFVNNALAIDLGGVHVRAVGTVALDTLGLVKGKEYPLDVFNAERRMIESNFSFTTTIKLQPAPQ